MKGQFKKGKEDGERLTYYECKVQQKAYFKDGKKVGTWEEYDSKSKLIRKTTYADNGNNIEDIKY